ncbi:MAG: DNA polymerase III subunit gamma and tau [Microbacteriaceae bacterium]|nr:DNA polymerase III subunit gamma and tau [Microbacteriaceae bacterium]
MSTALYRRYRPQSFTELIGQSQVTVPLMAALKSDRVNHAYLFSGPRGCGKTTSARILARCLNCAEGPTDTPCGKCPSCIELSRDGSGSLDVIEIDAASHNKVEDARELRERIAFAPSRDRYKIFILDEAHMVTKDGFNALLKVVEEPPAHVKFIFATTEPEKVISTIRSRTHHYPFRLVPPAQMLDYLQQMCASENIEVEEGVLSLVVRSGGGSVRDSLSLLDQLMAGSESNKITYERAVGLLGYTDSALLDEVVDALAQGESDKVFASVDRVIQSGQDPHRFVEDLLERIRDLIIVGSVGQAARGVLRDMPQDQLDRLRLQVEKFGRAELNYAADVIAEGLTRMNGATSPKLQLELMMAKVLIPAQDKSETGSLARIERLERRIGMGGGSPSVGNTTEVPAAAAAASVSQTDLMNAWPDVLNKLAEMSRSAWTVVKPQQPVAFDGEIIDILFKTDADKELFRTGGTNSPSEVLRRAIFEVLGIRVKYRAATNSQPQMVTEPIAKVEQPVQETVVQAAKPVEDKVADVNQKRNKLIDTDAQLGEPVLKDILGADLVEGDN